MPAARGHHFPSPTSRHDRPPPRQYRHRREGEDGVACLSIVIAAPPTPYTWFVPAVPGVSKQNRRYVSLACPALQIERPELEGEPTTTTTGTAPPPSKTHTRLTTKPAGGVASLRAHHYRARRSLTRRSGARLDCMHPDSEGDRSLSPSLASPRVLCVWRRRVLCLSSLFMADQPDQGVPHHQQVFIPLDPSAPARSSCRTDWIPGSTTVLRACYSRLTQYGQLMDRQSRRPFSSPYIFCCDHGTRPAGCVSGHGWLGRGPQ